MYTFGLYTLALSPCFLSPLADSLLLPFLIPFTYFETLLAAIGSKHPVPRLLVNWSPHLHPSPSAPHLLPICFPFRSPDPLWFSQVNAPFNKTTSQPWFPRSAHNVPTDRHPGHDSLMLLSATSKRLLKGNNSNLHSRTSLSSCKANADQLWK